MSIIIGEGRLNATYKSCGNKLFLENQIYFQALAENIFHLIGFTGTQKINDSLLGLSKSEKFLLLINE